MLQSADAPSIRSARSGQAIPLAKSLLDRALSLFADVRAYPSLSEQEGAGDVTAKLGEFYYHCSAEVWERDGIVNKLIGDAIFAIYNFPIRRSDHSKQAVLSGIELQT